MMSFRHKQLNGSIIVRYEIQEKVAHLSQNYYELNFGQIELVQVKLYIVQLEDLDVLAENLDVKFIFGCHLHSYGSWCSG